MTGHNGNGNGGAGWFTVHRDVFEHRMFSGEPYSKREAWLWMIAEAAFKPYRKNVGLFAVDLQRGQFAASCRFMADAWGWSKDTVHRFLYILSIEGMIKQVAVKKPLGRSACDSLGLKPRQPHQKHATAFATSVTIITICNYDRFQKGLVGRVADGETASEAQLRQPRSKSATNENNEDKNNTSLRSVRAREGDSSSFSGEGKEGKKARKSRATPIPEDFTLTETMLEDAKTEAGWNHVQAEFQFKAFVRNNQHTKALDWGAKWFNWCRQGKVIDDRNRAQNQIRKPREDPQHATLRGFAKVAARSRH
jgi:hypothetical protein